MSRIEDIEEPFMYRMPASALSVVAELNEKRYGKDAELKERAEISAVHIDGYQRHNNTEHRDNAEGHPLFPGFISVTEEEQCIQDIKNRPVAKKGQEAQADDAEYLAPFRTAAFVVEPDCEQGKQQRIDDAEGGIDKRFSVLDGNRQHAEFKETEWHPRKQCENAEACRIFSDISCVQIAFCQKISHRRSGQPADKVHDLSGQRFHWHECPCNMVNEHGNDDQIFQLIAVQRYGFHNEPPFLPDLRARFFTLLYITEILFDYLRFS